MGDDISEDGKNFIRSLLVTDPKKRLTARQAQKSKWIKEWAITDDKDDKKLNPSVVKALAAFKEYDEIHKLFCEIVSFALLPEQIQDLRKEFEKLDDDGSGEISIDNLKQVLIDGASAGSLGAMTEEEVEEICNSMVSRSDRKIRWHEFLAAGMSHCKVDDRNLRKSFERLDADHKGYVCLDDIVNLVGSDVLASGESIREILFKGLNDIQCESQKILYSDFQLLIKGQKKKKSPAESEPNSHSNNALLNQYKVDESGSDWGFYDAKAQDSGSDWGFYDAEDEEDKGECKPFYGREFSSILNPLNDVLKTNSDAAYDGPKIAQMRQAVLDGIKRFDEAESAQVLKTHKMKSKNVGAGLVMRRGETKTLSSEEVRKILLKQREEQSKKLEVASKRGGRGARNRLQKKTISDMSSLMGANNSQPRQKSMFLIPGANCNRDSLCEIKEVESYA